MALPRVNTPEYYLELPSTGEKIKYRPFLVKEQKIILMAQDTEKEIELANAIGKLVSECTFGSIDPNINPLFDLEYVFLQIRGKSVGTKVDLTLTCPDDNKTTVKYQLDLDDVNVQMIEDHSTEIKINENVTVNFRYPILKDMEDLKGTTSQVDYIFHIMTKCVESITFGDDVYNKTDISEKDITDFIDELTNDQFTKIIKFFDSMPKLRHIIEVTNPKTKVKSEVVLEGLESFLE